MKNPAISRILCPVDFSESSALAFARAREIARRFGAELRALHVWEAPYRGRPDVPIWSPAVDQLRDATPSEMGETDTHQAMQKLLGSEDSDVRITVQIESGHPATVITDLAERDGFDLIVMGTHGRSGFRRLVLGSVSEAVMKRAHCPVLIVPARMTEMRHEPAGRR